VFIFYILHDLFRDLGLQCCLRNICPVLKRETKENEKINLLSPKRVLYIGFFSTPTDVYCDPSDNPVVDGTHDDGHEQNLIEGVPIESAIGERI
jgi:hypothetical protein